MERIPVKNLRVFGFFLTQMGPKVAVVSFFSFYLFV